MATIHPTALVEEGATLHEGVYVGPYSTVGKDVTLGPNTRLISHVVITGKTTLGADNEVFPFASLGQVPQDLKYEGGATELVIGNGNSIREYVTMSLGTEHGGGRTVVGDNCLFMAHAHIGHDSHVGNHCVMANSATIAGHVELGDHAIIGGISAVHQFARIGRHAMIGGLSGIVKDVPPFCAALGNRSHLTGLNYVGLKRRNFERETIRTLKQVFMDVFEGEEGTLLSRAQIAQETYKNVPEVLEMVRFVMDSERGVTSPLDEA